jgi:hypothetical protein
MVDMGNAAVGVGVGNMPIPWTEHPHFDDIYAYEAGGEYSVRDSSFRKMKRMWTYWLNFANSVARPSIQVAPYKGLGLFGSTALPHEPQENGWDHVLIANFFRWLRDHDVATKDMVETGKLWMNHHLKAEAAAYGFGRSVYSCGTIAAVSQITREANEAAAWRAINNGEDLRAYLDISILDDQRERMLRGVLNTQDPQLRQRMKPLARLQFAAMLNKGFQTLNRAFELRLLCLAHVLVRFMEAIGHNGGSDNAHQITNQGKANKSGHLEYIAFARHVNPLQDPAAFDGLCFLQRFCVLFEAVPNFMQTDSYASFPLYCSCRDQTLRVNESAMGKHWKMQFDAYQVCCSKLTHQPRKQGQQHLDNCGVSASQIARAARHKQSLSLLSLHTRRSDEQQ